MSKEIEQIYDRLVAKEKLKDGTKYERLTALVFQVLEREKRFIQDVRLKADEKQSVHQIDVTATNRHSERKRILIECRDRTKKVEKDQVGDFHSKVVPLKPDAAWIVSRVGFTKGARTLAADEGIGLAVLKPATSEDADGRVRQIHVRGKVKAPGTPTITSWLAIDDAERERIAPLLAARENELQLIDATAAFVYDGTGEQIGTLESLLTPIFSSEGRQFEVGKNEGQYLFDEPVWLDLAGVRGCFRGFTYSVELAEAVVEFTIGEANAVAELVMRSLDSAIDRIFYDGEIAELAFDDDGVVVRRGR